MKTLLILLCLPALALSPRPAPAVQPGSVPHASSVPADSVQDERERDADHDLFEAETYLQEKNYGAAVTLLEEVLEQHPERSDVKERLAFAYEEWLAAEPEAPEEILARAVALYRGLLAEDPANRFALEGSAGIAERWSTPVEKTLELDEARDAWKNAEAEALKQSTLPEASRNWSGAIESYRAALRAEPRHPRMYVRLADALVAGDPKSNEARTLYSLALGLNPADVEALNGLASIEMASERHAEAENLLMVAFEIADLAPPGHQVAGAARTRELLGAVIDRLGEREPTARRHAYLGRIHMAEGNAREGIKALHTAADLDTASVAYRKYLGLAYHEVGDFNEALGWFQETLERDPDDPDALFHVGSLLFDLNHFEPAIAHLRPVADVPRYRGRASRLLGLALTRVEQHSDSAVLYLEKALNEGIEDPQLLCILGEQYLKLERWDDARTRFNACLTALPGHPAGLLGSGLVADHDRKYDQAIDHLETFLERHPGSPAVLMRLGLSYLKKGDADSAAARFRQAISTDTTLAAIQEGGELTNDQVFELGFLILMAGRNYEDGIVIGEHLSRKEPDNAGYANNLAMAYADAEMNLDRALELSRRANDKSPDNAGFLDTLGWTYVRLKRYKDAEETLVRAIRLEEAEKEPEASEIYYHMAFLLSEINRKDEALQYLDKALTDPANPMVESMARKLQAKLLEQ